MQSQKVYLKHSKKIEKRYNHKVKKYALLPE